MNETVRLEELNKVLDMLKSSWTWDRLTEAERAQFMQRAQWLLSSKTALKGAIKHQQEILSECYHMFLLGCGYTPTGWRTNYKNN